MRALVCAVSLVGCADEREEGARCDDEPNECIDGASLWNCASGEWRRVRCSGYCASIGLVNGGCLEAEAGPQCHCVPDDSVGPSCDVADAPAPRCVDVDEIEGCFADHFRIVPCGYVCFEAGFDGSSGCFQDPVTLAESCSCVRIGDPCAEPGHATCVAPDWIFHCTRGEGWHPARCEDVCAPVAAIGCVDDLSVVGSCLCDESSTTTGG